LNKKCISYCIIQNTKFVFKNTFYQERKQKPIISIGPTEQWVPKAAPKSGKVFPQ